MACLLRYMALLTPVQELVFVFVFVLTGSKRSAKVRPSQGQQRNNVQEAGITMGYFNVTFTRLDSQGVRSGGGITIKTPHYENDKRIDVCKRAFAMYASGVDNHHAVSDTGLCIELEEQYMVATVSRRDPFSEVYYLTNAKLHVRLAALPTEFEERIIASGLVTGSDLFGTS